MINNHIVFKHHHEKASERARPQVRFFIWLSIETL